MYKMSDEIISLISNAMENWRIELIPGELTLAEIKIQRSIFQGDSLSSLLFIIEMMPLKYIGSALEAISLQNS